MRSRQADQVISQEQLFVSAQRKKNAIKQKEYRQRQKANKLVLKQQEKLKWGKLGGVRKPCMRIHQYDMDMLRRIVQLGTCPTARGSFIPTARIATHMVQFG